MLISEFPMSWWLSINWPECFYSAWDILPRLGEGIFSACIQWRRAYVVSLYVDA